MKSTDVANELAASLTYLDNASSKLLWNDGPLIPHYTTSHSGGQQFSQSANENLKSHMRMLGIFWNKQAWYHNISINRIWCFHAEDCNNYRLLRCGAMQFGNISKKPIVSVFRTEVSLSSKFLQNFATHLQNYTVLHPTIPKSWQFFIWKTAFLDQDFKLIIEKHIKYLILSD